MTDNSDWYVTTVARIDSIPTILKVLCRTTGLRVAAVAHVTDQQWTACAVLDKIQIGLSAGDQLESGSTY